jgi:hypothetical protein
MKKKKSFFPYWLAFSEQGRSFARSKTPATTRQQA